MAIAASWIVDIIPRIVGYYERYSYKANDGVKMEFGSPEDFHNNTKVRLLSIKRAIAQYQFSAKHLQSRFNDKINQHTALFIKGFGNEINFLSSFRELFFNSRELLDIVLIKLNKKTDGQSSQTARSFLPFAKQLMAGKYNQSNLTIIDFLKTNISFIFHIRKIRNEIKNSPSSIKFRFNTNHFEAYFKVPVSKDEKELIQFLDIANKDQALANMSYNCIYILDEIFPEMLRFWEMCLSILENDISH